MVSEISVLIPVYNAEKYLEECLQSIRRQTFPRFEVILVDDGSTDRSGAICDRYASEDERFIVIHQENQGAGAARNTAIEWALTRPGKYIAWVDADDVVHDAYLETLYTVAERNPEYAMIQCGFSTSEKVLETWEQGHKDPSGEYAEHNFNGAEELLRHLIDGAYGISFAVLWNKLYKKEIYQNVRVYTDEKISGRIYDDLNLLWQLYLQAKGCLLVGCCLYYYRQTPNSIMHKMRKGMQLEFVEIYLLLYQYCVQNNLIELADFISERLLLMLANHLGRAKAEYEDFRSFYDDAKQLYLKMRSQMKIRCKRLDLRVLNALSHISFYSFRLYGMSYAEFAKLRWRHGTR